MAAAQPDEGFAARLNRPVASPGSISSGSGMFAADEGAGLKEGFKTPKTSVSLECGVMTEGVMGAGKTGVSWPGEALNRAVASKSSSRSGGAAGGGLTGNGSGLPASDGDPPSACGSFQIRRVSSGSFVQNIYFKSRSHSFFFPLR